MSAEPMTVAVVSKALDGLSMRMAAIAHNLANVNSARFQTVSVDFEDALRRAAAKGASEVDRLKIEFRAGHSYAAGEDRRMDLLIADASQTAMRYSALVDLLSERMALHRAATGDQA